MGIRFNPHARLWEYAVERKAKGVFAGLHWRDVHNNLDGMRYLDRVWLLGAIADSLDTLAALDAAYPEGRRDVVTWFGLALLQYLIEASDVRWGTGPPGYAVLPRGYKRYARDRHDGRPRWRDHLILNVLPVRDDCRFRGINFPHEITKLRRTLWRRIQAMDAVLPSRAFSLEVLACLQASHLGRTARKDLAAWDAILQTGQPVPTSALNAPFTARTVPSLLSYYGLGTPVKRKNERCLRVDRERVHDVYRRAQREGGLDLRDLWWMDGRYRFARKPPR